MNERAHLTVDAVGQPIEVPSLKICSGCVFASTPNGEWEPFSPINEWWSRAGGGDSLEFPIQGSDGFRIGEGKITPASDLTLIVGLSYSRAPWAKLASMRSGAILANYASDRWSPTFQARPSGDQGLVLLIGPAWAFEPLELPPAAAMLGPRLRPSELAR
jgi:hypothetical protein